VIPAIRVDSKGMTGGVTFPPKLGGPATALKLKTLFAGMPVLFTSGYSQDPEESSSVMADARFLQKPYSPTMLGRLVRKILNEAKERTLAS
jgi:hypothetical protein